MMRTPELTPISVAVRHLGDVRLGQPMAVGAHTFLPLSWGRPRAPGAMLMDVEDAHRRGLFELRDDGSVTNRGDRGILMMAGETVLSGARTRCLGRPVLIPPGTWSPLLIADAVREGARVPVGAFADDPPQIPASADRHGAVIFRGDRFESVILLASPSVSLDRRLTELILESLEREAVRPGEAPTDETMAEALKTTRRVFDRFRYAETELSDCRGDFSLVRVRAPTLGGWIVVEGQELAYLELSPRAA